MSMLDDRDRAILDFERGWQQHVGAKEEAIRAFEREYLLPLVERHAA